MHGDQLVEFIEKPELASSWINGGYFFFRRGFLDYLSKDEHCVFELEPLSRLAKDRQLEVFRHSGYWACMDTQRDFEQLNAVWSSGNAPWEPPRKPVT